MWRQGDKEPFLILVLLPVLCLSIVVLASVIWVQNQTITAQKTTIRLQMSDTAAWAKCQIELNQERSKPPKK